MSKFYVWHGEGECNNDASSLFEAKSILALLVADGHRDVYITNDDTDVVYDTREINLSVKAVYKSSIRDGDKLKEALRVACMQTVEAFFKDAAEELVVAQVSSSAAKVVIEMDGGLINQTFSSVPIEIAILDEDTEGADEDDVSTVCGQEVYVRIENPEIDAHHVSNVFSQIGNLEAISDRIKIGYQLSGQQPSDVQYAIDRLMTECKDLFEKEEAAYKFLVE